MAEKMLEETRYNNIVSGQVDLEILKRKLSESIKVDLSGFEKKKLEEKKAIMRKYRTFFEDIGDKDEKLIKKIEVHKRKMYSTAQKIADMLDDKEFEKFVEFLK